MTEKRKFEPESEIMAEENPTISHEEAEDEPNSKGLYLLLAVFIILFLTTASFFVYFQFYEGNGKWNFSLKKRTVDYTMIEKLSAENLKLKHLNDSLSTLLYENQLEQNSNAQLFTNELSGEKYEVQIGYFRNFDFSRYSPALINMHIDSSQNAIRLMIGRFESVEDACRFRKDIIELGIKNAFIVKKVDGKRVAEEIKCP